MYTLAKLGRQKPFNLFKRRIKLGNGDDSVVYYYSINPPSGVSAAICIKEQRKSTGCSTKADAETFVVNRIAELRKQSARNRSSLTLREYAEPFWIWDTCPHVDRLRGDGKSITKNHVQIQRNIMKNHLLTDEVVDLPIGEITRDDILLYRSRLIKKHGYSRTVQKAMGILKTVMKEAYFREHIDRDPTVGIGKVKYKPSEVGIFTPDELIRLFPADSLGPWIDHQGYTCFMLAATTGMRRGEILALEWRHIDFQKKCVIIEQAWKGRSGLGEPKWGKRRITPLPSITIRALNELYEDSIRTAPDDLVICNDDGSRYGETWWRKRFLRAMKIAGIDVKGRGLKPHSFRHTLNTILLDANQNPEKIRAALGWSHERTQSGYTHLDVEHLRDGANLIDDLFENKED